MADPARTCLVVGSSDGIGRRLVERMLARGWTVAGVSRSASAVLGEHHQHHVLDVQCRVLLG
jgi:NAD(P)-dependent dehydrogenase (short-subunit alcohol dehydrogenase family)